MVVHLYHPAPVAGQMSKKHPPPLPSGSCMRPISTSSTPVPHNRTLEHPTTPSVPPPLLQSGNFAGRYSPTTRTSIAPPRRCWCPHSETAPLELPPHRLIPCSSQLLFASPERSEPKRVLVSSEFWDEYPICRTARRSPSRAVSRIPPSSSMFALCPSPCAPAQAPRCGRNCAS